RGPAAPAEHPRVLQLPADELGGGLHPVRARSHQRRRDGERPLDGEVPPHVHERVPELHPARLHGAAGDADADVSQGPGAGGPSVVHVADLDLLVFEQQVAGTAGGTTPTARGRLDGAPVLGYVFPTTLQPTDV